MKTIDKDVLAGYNAGIEKDRLRSGLGLIEFERTKEILRQKLPPAPAVIYDIGGAYGEYSFWLSSLGYEVYLYDLSEKNIEMAREFTTEHPLKAMEVSDARSINRPDESADAVLLFGPLYHIVEYAERQLALTECYRLLKSGGLLFTAAITRYATILWAVMSYGQKNTLLDEPEFYGMIEHEIKTGHHIKNSASKYSGIGRSYFHLPDELKAETKSAGFCNTDVRGILGPVCPYVVNLDEVWKDEVKRESIMRIVRLCEREESIMGISTHLLTISEKGESV
ncbi:MAG: class I SAM-dependent methyltransferase [Oscillospiraceae bacterium]|nr:class I SAM-dependent methyltransferase [Oscillospiraceae bacterium]